MDVWGIWQNYRCTSNNYYFLYYYPQGLLFPISNSFKSLQQFKNKKGTFFPTVKQQKRHAQTQTVAGTPSSCRAPWLDTRMPSTPWFTARTASSPDDTQTQGMLCGLNKVRHVIFECKFLCFNFSKKTWFDLIFSLKVQDLLHIFKNVLLQPCAKACLVNDWQINQTVYVLGLF